MPPPNYIRKKQKSRSRGSSAKRSQNKQGNNSSLRKHNLRSSSVDVASTSSCASFSSREGKVVTNPKVCDSENLIMSLADNVATAAIGKAEKALKGSPHKKSSKKKGKDSAQNISNDSKNEKDAKDHPAELDCSDKLDNLSKLLDRLSTTYGESSVSSTNDQKTVGKVSHNNLEVNNLKGSPCKQLNKENLIKEQATSPVISNGLPENKKSEIAEDESALTQEEKQALRKAKKEAKKAGKKPAEHYHCNGVVANHIVETKPPVLSNNEDLSSKIEPKLEKSKAELKRERREKQEAQRAAKEVAKATKAPTQTTKTPSKDKPIQEKEKSPSKKIVAKRKETSKSERHLPLLEHLSTQRAVDNLSNINSSVIHPAIRAAGLSMKDMIIDGCISRVLTTLSSICSLIEDYQTPPSCDLSRDLSDQLAPNIAFLNACRPISEPINNAIRFVKREINEVESSVPERQAKEQLLSAIDTYVHQNIILASKAIIENALEYIENNDVILTFGFSRLVYETIKAASQLRDNLCIVMADNPGVNSGVNLLQDYVRLGVKVFYRIQPDLPHIIKKVTKVLVEPEAVVLNGAVVGYCGMAGVVMLASAYSVPVIVLSHTFKFCNIDLTDSLVVNELGDSSVIVKGRKRDVPGNYLSEWRDSPSLNVVNLIYDVTPPQLINVLVTERSNYPTSVVPIIIKRNYADILGHD